MPPASELPDSLRELAFNHGAVVRHDPDFHRDMNHIIAEIQSVLTPQPNIPAPIPVPAPSKPDKKEGWTENRLAVLLAVITFLGAVTAAAITIIPPMLERADNAATQAASFMLTEAPSLTAVANSVASIATQPASRLPAGGTDEPTQIPVQPTATESPQPTQTPEPILSPEEIAQTPVTRNEEWTPTERDFDGVAMVLVPVGCFMMGHNDGDDDEHPVHEQCFSTPFWIDKYEVTNAQFTRFAGHASAQSRGLDEDRPRENITWEEAQRFCALRGTRLPSESEWEYAARGPNNLIYPWGDGFLTDTATGSKNSNGQTAFVGSHPSGASWVDALDMSGNVWEWTNSYYAAYPFRETTTPSAQGRVYRGGAYTNDAYYLRVTFRDANTESFRYPNVGFRCAL